MSAVPGSASMFRALVQGVLALFQRFSQRFLQAPAADLFAPPALPKSYEKLERVVLTDAVARTLFDDFAKHKKGRRGDEEIGWVILGIREEREAIALATLPAGTQRSAGVAHVQFNSQ